MYLFILYHKFWRSIFLCIPFASTQDKQQQIFLVLAPSYHFLTDLAAPTLTCPSETEAVICIYNNSAILPAYKRFKYSNNVWFNFTIHNTYTYIYWDQQSRTQTYLDALRLSCIMFLAGDRLPSRETLTPAIYELCPIIY